MKRKYLDNMESECQNNKFIIQADDIYVAIIIIGLFHFNSRHSVLSLLHMDGGRNQYNCKSAVVGRVFT